MSEKEFIKNITVKKIIFHSQESNYAIFSGLLEKQEFVFKGAVSDISEGDTLDGEGVLKSDGRGDYYQMSFFIAHIPSDVSEISQYLTGLKIPGMGKKTCYKIAEKYQETLFDIVESGSPADIQIKGVGQDKIVSLFQKLNETIQIRGLTMFVSKLGLGMKMSSKILDFYGQDAVEKIKANPYRLMFDIEGIGFEKADAIGLKIGVPPNSSFRIRAMLYHRLRERGNKTGSTRFEFLNFFYQCESSLKFVSRDELMSVIWGLYENKRISLYQIGDIQYLSTSQDFYSEKSIAKHSWRLIDDLAHVRRNINIDSYLSELAMKGKAVSLTPSQAKAISGAVVSNFSLLIGPPGRGKTFTVKLLIDILSRFGHINKSKVGLVAPTGIAAKNLGNAAGMPAETIHRLLKYVPETGEFEFNEENRLENLDFVAVDEASMLDVNIGHSLLRAIANKTQVVVIGDKDQLQSVDRGAVLRDLMRYSRIPIFELKEGKRFSEESAIGIVSDDINNGRAPSVVNKKGGGFYFKKAIAGADIVAQLLKCIRVAKKQFNCTLNDIQVLTPKVVGGLGSDELSRVIKEFANPHEDRPTLWFQERCFSDGDRVVLTQNLYTKGVYNGDIGYVCFVNEKLGTLYVEFDTELVEFKGAELRLLSLAYALSVHKSQGSQFKVVIMPFHKELSFMLHRSMVYTAITRAKEAFIGIGDYSVLLRSKDYDVSDDRVTTLVEHLESKILRIDSIETLYRVL